MPGSNKQKESVSLWKMSKVETIEEFYKRKFNWMPDNLRKEMGAL
jgi:AraC family transcriptional regulator, transcriptional activator of pobA